MKSELDKLICRFGIEYELEVASPEDGGMKVLVRTEKFERELMGLIEAWCSQKFPEHAAPVVVWELLV